MNLICIFFFKIGVKSSTREIDTKTGHIGITPDLVLSTLESILSNHLTKPYHRIKTSHKQHIEEESHRLGISPSDYLDQVLDTIY